jgi:hypothetical protein
MGKKRKKKKKQKEQQIPQKQEISRRGFLGLAGKIAALTGAAAGVAGIGTYLAWPEQQKLEEIAEVTSDSFTEKAVKEDFAPLNYRDQKTIDLFVDSVNKYYDKIDELIKNRQPVTRERIRPLCAKLVLDPLYTQIKNSNKPLSDFINKKESEGGSRKDIRNLLDMFNEYFEKNGLSFDGFAVDRKYGFIIEFRMPEAEKEKILKGNICGNDVSTNVWYCNWPLKIIEYSVRHYKGTPGASGDAKRTYIFQGSERTSIGLLEDLKGYNPKESVKTFGDLGNALMYKGLKNHVDDPSQREELFKEISRVEKLHELAHVLYVQKTKKKQTNEEMQIGELFACLVSIKNHNDSLIYHSLGSVISVEPTVYLKAKNKIFDFYKKEMLANRRMYSNVDFSDWDKTKDNLDIMKQTLNLTVPQIRYMADKALKKFFPEICR